MATYPTTGSSPWGPNLKTYIDSFRENSKARYGSPPIDSRVDVDKFIAPNAAAKLSSIVTYVGDVNNEVVEPSVWYDPNGLFGYEYWMAAGPYMNSNSAFENPSIWVSHDGQTWAVPPGGSNPVVAAPGSGNYDDPHLYELGGTLYLVWNYTRAGSTGDQVLMTSTTDGITWTTPVAIRTDAGSTHGQYVSPHVEYQDGLWYMWTLDNRGTRTINLSTASTLTGTWSAPTACTMSLPTGKDHWEFEVRRVGGEWWMLQCVVDSGGTAAGGQLRFRTSTDGLTWSLSRRPVLAGNVVNSSGFDGNFIYKSSFVPLADGRMEIWYSAGSPPTIRWAIGYTVAEVPKQEQVRTACYVAPPTAVSTGLLTNGTVYYLPWYFDKAVSIQGLALEVTVAGSAGSTVNLGLYDDDGTGRPGRLIVDAGAITSTGTGVLAKATSQVIGPGVVWFASLALGAPATNPTVRMATTPTGVPIHSTTSTLVSGNALVGHRQTSQASLPAVAAVDVTIASSNIARPIYQAT